MIGRTDRVLIVHPDPAVRREIENVVRRAHKHSIAARHAGNAGAAVQLARDFDPRIVLLDLVQDRALALSVAKELRRPDRLIVGLVNPLITQGDSGGSEAEFLRQAVRAGVGDFAALPLSDAEIAAALETAPQGGPATQEGRTIAFFSHQGGVGTTTLAINTAIALRVGEPARSVVVMDANIQFGCVAAHLGMVPERDLGDAIRELDLGPMFPLPSTGSDAPVSVLASPLDPRAAEMITPEDVSRVVIELRRRFGSVVIDTAPVLDLMTLSVLDLSETVVVVTEPLAPTIAGTARLLGMLASLGITDDRVRLVVSRFRDAPDLLSPAVISQQLGRPVDHVVPFLMPVTAGTHRGVPAVFERGTAPFTDAMKRLARDVARGGVSARGKGPA
jgi:pilus assembly protein CpaE